MSASYGNDSIVALTGADRVRKRPAVIFGSDGLDGCQHAVFEILSNAIDEAREGHGDTIIVTRYEDLSIEVEDFGRGCPLDWNEKERRFNWELVFCELYAGGKYRNDADGNYEYSLGLNGLGSCATQYSSEYMNVDVWRDHRHYFLSFKHGLLDNEYHGLNSEPTNRAYTGTKIRWKPDLDVFTDINIPVEYYLDTLKKQAVVNAGVTFEFREQRGHDFIVKTFKYNNGIIDYINEIAGENPLSAPFYMECERRGRDRSDMKDYKVKITAVFCFSNKSQRIEYYHNSSWLEYGGSPDKATKKGFVTAIDSCIKKANKYKKNETSISFPDIQDCLILITSCFSTQTSYENQIKKAITNKFIQDAMTDFFKEQLCIYFSEHVTEANKIFDQILVNKRSREQAEKTRLNIKKKLTGSVDIINRIEKFVDCRSKDVSKREIYICEGDSAAGAIKLARDAEHQAIMPVRGKILNCLKVDYERIFKSEIIVDLLKILGCGVQIKGRKVSKDLTAFDINNLRWDKVIICTDADVDGFQIRTLILTMIYRLVPDLIQHGKVYIAESPLYEIRRKDKIYFAYSDKEKNDIVKKFGDSRYSINRSKGLGENEPEMMWLTTMSPTTRKLIRITPSGVEETARVFDLLLGNNLAGRKQHIADVGKFYIDQLDIS